MNEKELLEIIAKAERKRAAWLNLSGNSLTSVPPELARLTSLQRLDLSANQLTSLPPELAQLTNLRELYLYTHQESDFGG
jgi:Leucine-rich repeat (LRR) protein